MHISTELVVILALVAANGIFAAAELAVISVRRTRIAARVREGRAGARALLALRNQPEQFLATVQIGLTVVSATAAAFGGARLAQHLEGPIAQVPVLAPYAPDLALALVVALVSFLSLVLGELVPKSLALRSPEAIALGVARPLLGLSAIVRPLAWLLTAASNLVLRPFGDRTTFGESRLSADELAQLLEEAGKAGSLDAATAELASRALAFRELVAAEVMVPRSRIVALRADASQDEIRRLLLEEGRSRMPVYQGSLDEVVGYVMTKDLAAMLWERQLIVLADLVRPVHFVPSSAPAVRVLRDMQRQGARLAIVVDEHGGVAGLLTLEDIVEELVGELVDELEHPPPLWHAEEGGTSVVRGDAPLREVNRALAAGLPEGDGYSTVAGLCVALAGTVPEPGTRLVAPGGAALEVLDATPRVVRAVRLRPAPPAAAESLEPPSGQ